MKVIQKRVRRKIIEKDPHILNDIAVSGRVSGHRSGYPMIRGKCELLMVDDFLLVLPWYKYLGFYKTYLSPFGFSARPDHWKREMDLGKVNPPRAVKSSNWSNEIEVEFAVANLYTSTLWTIFHRLAPGQKAQLEVIREWCPGQEEKRAV